jgi:hypothetical protein
VVNGPVCSLLAGEVSSHFSCAELSFHVTTATNLCLMSHVPNKEVETTSTTLVLVAVVRNPIEWLTALFAHC